MSEEASSSYNSNSICVSDTRKKSYKTQIDAQESRRRREEDLIAIRNIKRENLLTKRRETTNASRSGPTLMQAMPQMIRCLSLQFPDAKAEITAHLETLLSLADQRPPIDHFLKEGILPRFVEFLSRDVAPQLQLEALWVLNNFAYGKSQHISVVVELDVVPSLVNLLSSSTDDEIKEETVYALGAIAGDSPSYRDLILNNGALPPLLSQLNPIPRLPMLRVTTWTLSNLVRGKPPVNFEQVKAALPILERLIHETNEEVATDACCAIYDLSDGPIDQMQAIIEAGVCPKLVELLQSSSDIIILPALQTLGNIVTGDEAQIQLVIDNGLLPCLHQLLTREFNKSIYEEVCLAISNITAGNGARIEAVINANIIPPLVRILQHDEFEIKTEAAWAIYNVICGGSHDNIRFLAAEGCIEPLCNLLTCPDPTVVSISLEGLENILRVGEADKEMGLHGRVNIFSQRVDECGGLDMIQILMAHENNEISDRAVSIFETYWPERGFQDTDQSAGDGSQ